MTPEYHPDSCRRLAAAVVAGALDQALGRRRHTRQQKSRDMETDALEACRSPGFRPWCDAAGIDLERVEVMVK